MQSMTAQCTISPTTAPDCALSLPDVLPLSKTVAKLPLCYQYALQMLVWGELQVI